MSPGQGPRRPLPRPQRQGGGPSRGAAPASPRGTAPFQRGGAGPGAAAALRPPNPQPIRQGPGWDDHPPVLVDDRAGSKDLIKHFPLSVAGVICRLDAGDASFSGNGPEGTIMVGVEVKSISDLLASTDTGRIAGTQLPAMLQHFDASWLLVYGVHRPDPETGALQVLKRDHNDKGEHGFKGKWLNHYLGSSPVPYGYMESFLLTLTAAGLRVKQVSTMAEAAEWIGVLARWWSKPWDKHRSLRTFDNSSVISVPSEDPQVVARANFAKGLPGIGYERALAAAKHFPSIQAMVNAPIQEWEKVPGIGKVLARVFFNAVR